MMTIKLWRTILLVLSLYVAGCAPVPGRGFWGEQARWPRWQELGDATVHAASDPKVWMPAIGSMIFSLGSLDEDVSAWGSRRQPLFGRDASDDSSDLRTATTAAYAITALVAPSGDSTGEWAHNKGRGLAVGIAAIGLNDLLTLGIKEATGRERPDGSDHHSYISGHASQAAARAAAAARNLDYIAMPGWERTALKTTFYALAAGTGWARVEGKRHYPSDVLAGFAFGNFIVLLLDQALLSPRLPGTAAVALDTSPEKTVVTFSLVF